LVEKRNKKRKENILQMDIPSGIIPEKVFGRQLAG
jgi:hypothetical protein